MGPTAAFAGLAQPPMLWVWYLVRDSIAKYSPNAPTCVEATRRKRRCNDPFLRTLPIGAQGQTFPLDSSRQNMHTHIFIVRTTGRCKIPIGIPQSLEELQ